MKYTTYYVSSNGQPSNGRETHETLNAALAAWESNIRALLYRSGGNSTLQAWEDAELHIDHAQPAGSISWIEHCEGGYVCADGIFSDDLAQYARYVREGGDELTPAKVVRHLSE